MTQNQTFNNSWLVVDAAFVDVNYVNYKYFESEVHVVPTWWLKYLRRQFVCNLFYYLLSYVFFCISILYTFVCILFSLLSFIFSFTLLSVLYLPFVFLLFVFVPVNLSKLFWLCLCQLVIPCIFLHFNTLLIEFQILTSFFSIRKGQAWFCRIGIFIKLLH